MRAREIIEDVDATIARWKSRGVLAADIGADLRCHRSWPSIRGAMLAIELSRIAGEELQRAA